MNIQTRAVLWTVPETRGNPTTASVFAVMAFAVGLLAMSTLNARASVYPGTVSIWATMGEFSPTLVRIITGKPYPSATSSLNAGSPASYNPPPPSSDESEGKLSPIYTWTWQVNYKSSEGASYASAPSADYAVNAIPASSLPGATLVFVPKVPAYWQVQVTCYVTVTDQNDTSKTWNGHSNANNGPRTLTSYTFDITYTGSVAGGTSDSGSVVSNQTINVHAGWPIKLGAKITPSDLATQFTWMISGAGGNGAGAIGGYTPIAGATSVTPLAASNATTDVFPGSATPSGAYYYTTNNKFAASVAPTNNTEIPYVMTTFDVAKAMATLSTKTSVVCGGDDSTLGNGAIDMGDAFLTALDPSSPNPQTKIGITFNSSPGGNSSFSGSFNFVQLYTSDDNYYDSSGKLLASNTQTGLDNTFPYGNQAPVGANQADTTNDNPARGPVSGVAKITVADTPIMWLMYKPAAAGSIWVPIDSVNWNWGGTDYYDGNTGTGWNTTGTTQSNNPPGMITNTYPVWSTVVKNTK